MPRRHQLVSNEAELRSSISRAVSSASGHLQVQLSGDIQLTQSLVLTAPVHIHGRCGTSEGPCTISAAAPPPAQPEREAWPLLVVSGPAAHVQLQDLKLTGARGGALLAANQSWVDLRGVELAGNFASEGGGLAAQTQARVTLVGCSLHNNTATGAGGGIAGSGGVWIHLRRSLVSGNSAPRGAGIYLAGGAKLTSAQSEVAGNAPHSVGGAACEAAAAAEDVLMQLGSSAWFEPLPGSSSSIVGGEVQPLGALGGRHLHRSAAPVQHEGSLAAEQQADSQGSMAAASGGLGGRSAVAAAEHMQPSEFWGRGCALAAGLCCGSEQQW